MTITHIISLICLCATASAMTPVEYRAIRQVAQQHELSAHETALLLAIGRVENGGPGIEFGIGQDNPNHPARRFAKYPMRSLVEQASWAARLIKDYYDGDVYMFGRNLYCPLNPDVWSRNVRYWYKIYAR